VAAPAFDVRRLLRHVVDWPLSHRGTGLVVDPLQPALSAVNLHAAPPTTEHTDDMPGALRPVLICATAI
jgi:hypothetical protein